MLKNLLLAAMCVFVVFVATMVLILGGCRGKTPMGSPARGGDREKPARFP